MTASSDVMFRGVVPPVATALNADYSVDAPGLERLLDHLLGGGVHGLFLLGSCAEAPMLPLESQDRIVEIATSHAGGAVPICAGALEPGTLGVLRRLEAFDRAKIAAAVVTLPFYYPVVDAEGAVRHFEYLADRSPIPIIVYNQPAYTAFTMDAPTMMELARHKNVVGIKDSSGDIVLMQKLAAAANALGRPFFVLDGNERAFGLSVLMGAHGGVPGVANIDPGGCVEIYDKAMAGDAEQVARLQHRIIQIRDRAKNVAPGFSYEDIKASLHLMGICQPHVPPPVVAAPEPTVRNIRLALEEFGLLPAGGT